MAKSRSDAFNSFGELLGLKQVSVEAGISQFLLEVAEKHLNPHQVIHGGVLYTMADTGMGAALYDRLTPDESCTTIEIKINYIKPVTTGILICESKVIHRGRRTALIESNINNNGQLVVKAMGTFFILDLNG